MIYNRIKYFLLFIFCFCGVITLNAQETYKGFFQLTDTIAGQAEYNFVRKNNADIFQGNFKFNYSKKFEELFKNVSYNGQFDDNRKTGKWLFSSKNLIKSDSLNISDYQISYTSNGFEYRVQGEFRAGKAWGNWLVVEQNLKDAAPADTIFSSSAVFENGKMLQQLKSKSQQMSLDGVFDNNGMANGKWIIIHENNGQIIEEQRVYENGVFKMHFFKYDGEMYEIEHFGLDTTKDEDEANWEIIDIRNQYFSIFELSNIGLTTNSKGIEASEVKKLTHMANNFMEKSITSFVLRNNFNIWNNITQGQEIEFGKFKVRKYPFSERENELMTEIKSFNKDIAEIIKQFFNNPQIEIGRLNFESLNRCYAILEVYKNKSSKIHDVADKITNSSSEYLDRSIFFKSFAPTFDFGNEIRFGYNENTFAENYNFPKVPSHEDFNIETANTFFKAVYEDLNVVFNEASIVLKDLQKIEEIAGLEESLVEKRNEIQQRFSNQLNDENFNSIHERLSDVAQNFSEQHFKSYAALNLDDKKQKIDDYLACFDEVLSLYDFLADLQYNINKLDENYIRTTFNPYLMVDMDERVKERLYNAYIDIALPYLLEKMKNEFECQKIDKNTELIKNLINKMSQFRNEDTALKERQLRRVKEASEVLNIIELDIN